MCSPALRARQTWTLVAPQRMRSPAPPRACTATVRSTPKQNAARGPDPATHVVLDTSACIYYLDCPPTDPRCAVLLPVVRSAEEEGELDLLVSTVAVTELLACPLQGGDREAEASVRLFLDLLCRVVPVDRAVAERAAALRAHHGLRTLVCADEPPPDTGSAAEEGRQDG